MTSTFILDHGEEFIQCPYNTAHQITNARLIFHLEKCRRAYLKDLSFEERKKQKKICRHNASHHIDAPEIRFHEARCPDGLPVVRHLAYHNSDEGHRQYEMRTQDSNGHSQRTDASSSSNASGESRNGSRKRHCWEVEEENWEADSCGYTAGYNPEIKLKSEAVIYNPAGLSKSERKRFRTEVRQKAEEMNLNGEQVEFPTASSFSLAPHDEKQRASNTDFKNESKELSDWPAEAHSEVKKEQTKAERELAPSTNRKYLTAHRRQSKKQSLVKKCEDEEDDSDDSDDFAGYDPYKLN